MREGHSGDHELEGGGTQEREIGEAGVMAGRLEIKEELVLGKEKRVDAVTKSRHEWEMGGV